MRRRPTAVYRVIDEEELLAHGDASAFDDDGAEAAKTEASHARPARSRSALAARRRVLLGAAAALLLAALGARLVLAALGTVVQPPAPRSRAGAASPAGAPERPAVNALPVAPVHAAKAERPHSRWRRRGRLATRLHLVRTPLADRRRARARPVAFAAAQEFGFER
jgi:hypothetical protein